MTTFAETHKKTVEEFLNGVVLIDDQVKYNSTSLEGIPHEAITTPDDFGELNFSEELSASTPIPSHINIKDIQTSFSDKGVHCLVHKYEDDEGIQKISNLMDKSDVIIFDWELKDKHGSHKTALGYIQDVISKNINSFRYLVIYTSNKDEAKNSISQGWDGVTVEENNYRMLINNADNEHITCCIDIISKSTDVTLANKIIDGFSSFSIGFMRNSVLSALGAVRSNTFKLLSLYPSEIDSAAISHYTALQSSESCNRADILFRDYVSGLMSSHINDILVYSQSLKDAVSKESISSHTTSAGTKAYLNSKGASLDNINLEEALKASHLEEFSSFSFSALPEPRKFSDVNTLTTSFKKGENYLSLSNDNEQFKKLAFLDCCRNRYMFSDDNPPLKFGTVVVNNEEFYICIQPPCDSVRLSGSTPFPFVKVKKSRNTDRMDFVVCQSGSTYTGLRTCSKPHQKIVSYSFDNVCSTNGDIRAINNIFASENGEEFTWVSELNKEYTQALVHKVTSNGSRIGMDQFEWLRFKAK